MTGAAGDGKPLRVAAAPISWGVCEVPGWGHQMDAGRVLSEARSLGVEAVEAGPDGFLPEDPGEIKAMLDAAGLRLVGGFVPAVLHRPERREEQLSYLAGRAAAFARAGAEVLVLAAATGEDGYEEAPELSEGEWSELLANLSAAWEICAGQGLTLALHPHFGTAVERERHVERVLEGSEVGLCFDTGHLAVAGADPVRVLKAAADRVVHVHLKDVDAALASSVASYDVGYEAAVAGGLFRPLGEGDLDLEAVLALLDGAGYGGWYVLEQDVMLDGEPDGAGPVEDVGRSLRHLRELDGAGAQPRP